MTESMSSLRRQINTTRDLHSVVTTMRALASVNIRQYQEAVDALEEYRKTIELGFQIVLKKQPRVWRMAEEDDLNGGMIAIVIGSDQGLVGQFNQQAAQYTHQIFRQQDSIPDNLIICAIGLRLEPYLSDMGYDVAALMRVPGTRAAITPTVREILLRIADWRSQQQIHRLALFFNRPTGKATYAPQHIGLLPLDPDWLHEISQRSWNSRSLPTTRLDWLRLFEQLLQQYFFTSLYFALASSLASENASRLASMESAKDNIEDRLAELQQRYNQHRQGMITEELFDVIAGFEVLRDQ